MTSHNIIANLAKLGIPTTVFGVCGNDIQGKVSINSLEKLNVDISNVKILNNVRTRCFHVSYYDNGFTSKKRCPYCNNKKWYDESLIDCQFILNSIAADDILVFDNLNNKNQVIIDKSKNKKIIDLGQYFEFENIENNEIIKKIKNNFDIINFNERVTKFLIKKFNLKNDLELFKCLNPKFMSITRGEHGATFIYKDKLYEFNLSNKGKVIDSTGAGDAFISSIIKDWIKNDFNFNPDIFEEWYNHSSKITSKVVSKMGARGHINSLFKIQKMSDVCACDNFSVVERKKLNVVTLILII